MKLVEVAKLQNDSEAMVVKSLLESNGIRTVFQSNLVQSVHPITVDGIGVVRILVRPEDADKARAILDENDLPRLVAE